MQKPMMATPLTQPVINQIPFRPQVLPAYQQGTIQGPARIQNTSDDYCRSIQQQNIASFDAKVKEITGKTHMSANNTSAFRSQQYVQTSVNQTRNRPLIKGEFFKEY
eukprot:TRINITY_DN24763_c0_g1_i1.p1 TRINITY_DN24763_c0_g1~~TRINITY_DN24763_c0_g1_i1.p1  ORF type:complete len:107 (+),score=1.51 TRINITY_DN24763_c0_g1_i1:108-428(+)